MLNTSNFNKDVKRHMTNRLHLAIKEIIRYGDARQGVE